MAKPTTRHMARYRQEAGTGDGRLVSPTFERNAPPIIAALSPWLTGRSGTALEIGSGTGQHSVALSLAFPALHFVASDPDAPHRASAQAWATQLGLDGLRVLDLDAGADWASEPEIQALGPLALVISMNVIHIAPPAVLAGIVAGAGQRLAPDGYLIFYGPFRENGVHTGAGNEAFDAGLRAENPEWGLRDTAEIDELARQHGLGRAAMITMPANNRLLIYRKSA